MASLYCKCVSQYHDLMMGDYHRVAKHHKLNVLLHSIIVITDVFDEKYSNLRALQHTVLFLLENANEIP